MTSPVSVGPSELELAGRMRAVLVPLERHLRRQSDDRFTPTQLSVIGAIYRHGPIALGDLAGRERLSPPTISKVVATLEAEGIVDREYDAQDRRVCFVTISRSGARWIAEGRVRRDRWLAERIAALSVRDRAALTAALPLLESLIDDGD